MPRRTRRRTRSRCGRRSTRADRRASAVQISEEKAWIGQATGGLQLLDHSSDAGLKDIEGGFQNAAGNLTFDARISDGIDVYAELYLSSPNHVGDVFDREGYMYIDYLPEMFGEK